MTLGRLQTRSELPPEIGNEADHAARQHGIPGLQVRHLIDLNVRADDGPEVGTFDGYACVWNVVDSYGTTFKPGCFREGGLDQSMYALLWMHSPFEPIGVFLATEDDHGLKIEGRWDDTNDGRDARVRARSGSAPGLSVGFVPIGTDPDDPSAFTVCRLVETSQITARMAAVPGAELVGARAAGYQDPDVRSAQMQDDERASRAALARLRLLVAPSRVG
jgi:HK97 family phage prohead protease